MNLLYICSKHVYQSLLYNVSRHAIVITEIIRAMPRKIKLLLLTVSLFTFSQFSLFSQNFKETKIIYLWDVTLSMKGYGGAPDIYNDVRNALVSSIEGIEDETSTLTVIPFQQKVLNTWTYPATRSGKKQLIDKIMSFSSDDITNTNICETWDYCINTQIEENKKNFICLLTDGTDNVLGTDALIERIKAWCKKARTMDAYAAYVMLTKAAQNDRIREAIAAACNFDLVELDGNERIVFPDFYRPLENTIAVSLKELERGTALEFSIIPQIKGKKIGNVRLSLEPNPYFTIPQETVKCKDNTCAFGLRSNTTFDELKEELDKVTKLTLTAESPDKNQIINFNEIELQIINYPEKILNIYVEEE